VSLLTEKEIRWGTGDPDRARTSTTELISLAPDVIVAHGTPALGALHRATRTIPVVFVSVIDPVGAGYVQSLALPGGNISGFSTFEPEIGGKWLELLKEIAPGLSRVAGILDPGFKGFAGVWGAIENMAPRFGLEVKNLHFQAPTDDLKSAVARFAQEPRGGLIVIPTALNAVQRNRIISSAARSGLPAMYAFRFYATDGGLMSYGIDTSICFGAAHPMWIEFSKVRSQPIFLCKHRRNSRWSSISGPRRGSALKFHQSCSRSLTR
jgi:putative ABC transport system substrate-binding protein